MHHGEGRGAGKAKCRLLAQPESRTSSYTSEVQVPLFSIHLQVVMGQSEVCCPSRTLFESYFSYTPFLFALEFRCFGIRFVSLPSSRLSRKEGGFSFIHRGRDECHRTLSFLLFLKSQNSTACMCPRGIMTQLIWDVYVSWHWCVMD